eukprot:12877211-Alexandrium_andersonii.AAC.1
MAGTPHTHTCKHEGAGCTTLQIREAWALTATVGTDRSARVQNDGPSRELQQDTSMQGGCPGTPPG